MKQALGLMLLAAALLSAGDPGTRVQYFGGTVAGFNHGSQARLDLIGNAGLVLDGRSSKISVSYRAITNIEYGMKVDQRYMEAILISPIFLLAHKKTHYLTIGFTDEAARQQAVVLQVPSGDIRSVLVSLEARTGLRIEYQDDQARKEGK